MFKVRVVSHISDNAFVHFFKGIIRLSKCICMC